MAGVAPADGPGDGDANGEAGGGSFGDTGRGSASDFIIDLDLLKLRIDGKRRLGVALWDLRRKSTGRSSRFFNGAIQARIQGVLGASDGARRECADRAKRDAYRYFS